MFENIKSSSHKVKWNLREVHKITEYKDECVYRTRSLGYIVCLSDYQLLKTGDFQSESEIDSVSYLLELAGS